MTDRAAVAQIRAIAADVSADPKTRAMARTTLDTLRKSHPHLFHRPVRVAAADAGIAMAPFDRFTDLGNWREGGNGSVSIVVAAKGAHCRASLFPRREQDGWKWVLIIVETGAVTYSPASYLTRDEAHKTVWQALENL